MAVTEAARCLRCHDAPCIKGCPARIEIPSFIQKIYSGNLVGAARVIYAANVLGGVCAYVCPTEYLCEKECAARLLDRAIPIGALQRVACDFARERGLPLAPARGRSPGTGTGRRAAVVGGGPAGLAAAHHLVTGGWQVTLYEAGPAPGGQLASTIPPYRLPAEVVGAEVTALLSAGVQVVTGVRVGRDLPANRLLGECDAVILAAGLGSARRPGIPGEGLAGVADAEEFLARARSGGGGDLVAGRVVVVVGGGNTAMDAACTAARLGATRVTVLYRRTMREMPAWRREYLAAVGDGVEFQWLVRPVAFVGDGRVRGVKCQRLTPGEPDASGRPAPVPREGTEFEQEAEVVLLALGREANYEVAEAFGVTIRGTRVVADPDSGATSVPGVFAAGDLVNGGATVVQAVAEGKKVASYLAGR